MSYLADVKMPEEINLDEEGEDNPNFVYPEDDEKLPELELKGVEEEPDPLPPPPEKKVKLKKEDIFKPKRAPPKKKKIEPQPEPEVQEAQPIVPKIAPVKKKRQLSEKQLAALARGREARKKKKEPISAPVAAHNTYQPDPQAVEYKQKKMEEDYQKQQILKSDLEEMVFLGVQKYDTQRKARKAIKQKKAAKEQHDNKVFKDINSALNRTNDPYNNCFSF